MACPAPTVVGSHVLVWVDPARKPGWYKQLSPTELAALQTFPPEYTFPKSKTHAYQQIGDAVPPLVAELMLRNA